MRLDDVAIASLLVPAALLAFQAERIVVRLAPAPNQTLHLRTSQDVLMTLEQDPTGSGAPIAPEDNHWTLTMETTSTVGSRNKEGHYESRVVLDSVSSTATTNGQPMTPPIGPASGLAFTLVYDDEGKVIDGAAPPGPPKDAAAGMTQLLTSVMSTAAPMTLAIGETVTVPDRFDVPIPATGAPATNEVPAMTGETRYTLTSVTFDGADRIAHLTTARTATLSQSPAGGSGTQVSFEQRITGDGTVDVNVDRGMVVHRGQRLAIDVTIRTDDRNGAAPRATRSRATVTISSDLVK